MCAFFWPITRIRSLFYLTSRSSVIVAGMKAVEPREERGFGPRAILLGGFSEEDTLKVRAWFRQMEPALPVIFASAANLSKKVGDVLALEAGEGAAHDATIPLNPLIPVDPSVPQEFVDKASSFTDGHVCLFSGFSGTCGNEIPSSRTSQRLSQFSQDF